MGNPVIAVQNSTGCQRYKDKFEGLSKIRGPKNGTKVLIQLKSKVIKNGLSKIRGPKNGTKVLIQLNSKDRYKE